MYQIVYFIRVNYIEFPSRIRIVHSRIHMSMYREKYALLQVANLMEASGIAIDQIEQHVEKTTEDTSEARECWHPVAIQFMGSASAADLSFCILVFSYM